MRCVIRWAELFLFTYVSEHLGINSHLRSFHCFTSELTEEASYPHYQPKMHHVDKNLVMEDALCILVATKKRHECWLCGSNRIEK